MVQSFMITGMIGLSERPAARQPKPAAAMTVIRRAGEALLRRRRPSSAPSSVVEMVGMVLRTVPQPSGCARPMTCWSTYVTRLWLSS